MKPTRIASPGSRTWAWLGAFALLAYGIFLAAHFTSVAGGSDSSGYLNNARLLAAGNLTLESRTVPELGTYPWNHFVPLGFSGHEGETRLVPTYPVGSSLHYTAASFFLGWFWGPLFVGVAAAVATIFLCYTCARELEVSPPLAAAGAASLAVCSVFLFTAQQVLSDSLAVAWCITSAYAALRARRTWSWSVICGGAFAIAVLVRPTNAILLPALVLLLWNWRNLLGAALGGLPGAIALAAYQHLLYGNALQSGYGAIYTMFHARYFVGGMAHFGLWLARMLPIVLVIVPLGFLLPWRRCWREIAGLVVWFATFTIFYALYPISQEVWWCLRFILPAFPAAVMLGALALESAAARATLEHTGARTRIAIAAAVVAVSVAMNAYWIPRLSVLQLKLFETPYVTACTWAAKNLPHDSVVACMQASGALYFYTDRPILRWDQISPEDFAKYSAALRVSGRPLHALLFTPEEEEAMKHMPGTWEKIAAMDGVDIWKFASAAAP